MNKQIVYLFLLIFLVQPSTALLGQEPVVISRTNNKIVLEGKVYYVHVVKAGHTLYSIAKAYNVTEKEIVIENPGINENIRIGQVLKIPDKPTMGFDVDTAPSEEQKDLRHVMREGETLYSISRMYKCSVEDIEKLNPNLDINDIPVGYSLRIPCVDDKVNDLSFDEEGIIRHKVKRGETLFSIARYYRTSVRAIRNENTELGWGGPRIDEVLRIPQPRTVDADIFVVDSVEVDSALTVTDSIQDIFEYEFNEVGEGHFGSGKIYNVAYMIPFNYEEMEPLDSLLVDVTSPVRRKRITEDYMMEKRTPKSVNFLEFMQGSLLAIDSLTDAGARFNVHFFDTKRSMYTTRSILDRLEMEDMDLIIGPFYPFNLALVSEFSKEHRIPLVAPFHSHDSLLYKNPYLFQPIPSYKTEIEKSVEFVSRAYQHNLIFVHSGDSAELDKINYYKEHLFSELEKYSALETVLFKEVIITNGNSSNLLHALKPDMKNLIILPGSDEAFASQVVTVLNYQLEAFDIEVFGSTYWLGFDDIEINYIHALNLNIPHTHWYDYHNESYLNLLEKFRDNYFREPAAITRQGYNFGVTGYDLSLYFLSALSENGKRFILKIDEHHPSGTQCDYRFEKLDRKSGFENKELKYYSFEDELKVVEEKLPEHPPVHHYLQPAIDDSFYHWQNQMRSDSVKVEGAEAETEVETSGDLD